MRSIRLSLVVYFLVLLAVALGAVSSLVYWTTAQIVQARKETTRKLLASQYERRCRQERDKFDNTLYHQARALAGLAQVQYQGNRSRLPNLAPLGLLTAALSPQGHAQTSIWLAESLKGPLATRINRLAATEIQFNEEAFLNEEAFPPHPEGPITGYFQITTEWGNSWRSRTMEDVSFPLEPDLFAAIKMFEWKYDDVELVPGILVRRVSLKVPVSRFRYRLHAAPSRPPNRMPPEGGALVVRPAAPPQERPPMPPNERVAESAAPSLLIQCAGDTSQRDEVLEGFKIDLVKELDHLEQESAATLTGLHNHLLGIGLATFAASVLGGCCLVWLGLSPLRRLSEAVSRVSEKDFRLQFHEPRLPRELRPIVERLSQTLAQLQRAFAREKQAAADISHELRTPLAALLTTTEVALRKERSSEDYRQLLGDCRLIGQQMSQQVERLLALARLDAGVDTLRPEHVDAAAVANQCAALVRPLAEARNLSLTVQQNGPAALTVDPDKLREVLTNLLHNAIEYNRPEGSVDVSVQRQNGELMLQVRDTGIGMTPEVRQHIFERFYRAEPSREAAGLHAGLGLAIVKGYVDLMGGKIEVDSKQDQGSTFRVRLPAGHDKVTR